MTAFLRRTESAFVLLTLAVGWAAALSYLDDYGWVRSGFTAILLALAAAATVGGLIFAVALKRQAHLPPAVGLVLVAVAPTAFLFPLNLLILTFAVTELGFAVLNGARTIRTKRRTKRNCGQ